MTTNLTKLELMQLLNHDLEIKTARLKEINKELEIRMADLEKIQSKINSGQIYSMAELNSMLSDLDNHLDRVKQLKSEGQMFMADLLMDTTAINQAR